MSSLTILGELGNKIRGVFMGLFGAIVAGFSVSVGVSVLTDNQSVVLMAGFMVGLAGSFANSFGPIVSKYNLSTNREFSKSDIVQAGASFILTFIVVNFSLVPYLLMPIPIARIISVMIGLVLLFIFGIQRAQLEYDSPLLYGFGMALVGGVCAMACYWVAVYFSGM